jgi:hypothetical protein
LSVAHFCAAPAGYTTGVRSLLILRLLRTYLENWRILRRAVHALGSDCEAWEYDRLDKAAEEQPAIERTCEGHTIGFQIDCWDKKANGDLILCIDAFGLPTLLGFKPTYQFAKRMDGSTYYP